MPKRIYRRVVSACLVLDDSIWLALAVRASIDLLGDRGGDAPPGGGAGREHALVRSRLDVLRARVPVGHRKAYERRLLHQPPSPSASSLSTGSPFPDPIGRGNQVAGGSHLFVPCRCRRAARNSDRPRAVVVLGL